MSVRPIAAWRQMQNWFNSQAAVTQQDTSANSAFATAQSNYVQNSANLTANAALKRVQAQSKAASAQLQALIKSVGSNVNTVA